MKESNDSPKKDHEIHDIGHLNHDMEHESMDQDIKHHEMNHKPKKVEHETEHDENSMEMEQDAHIAHKPHQHVGHHESMVEDFKKRFWISLILTIPVIFLSPMIQEALGLGESIRFSGDLFILFIISSIIFFYGGYPFFKGIVDEFRSRTPGMMTLISVAITTAYIYSGWLFLV